MTRLMTAAILALVGSAPAALAYNDLGAPPVQKSEHAVEFDTISVTGPGMLLIYEREAGGLGDLIGSQPLHMGANSDVYVPLSRNPHTEAIAVLLVDGQEVDSHDVRFSAN